VAPHGTGRKRVAAALFAIPALGLTDIKSGTFAAR
jgi:hypothetical protein